MSAFGVRADIKTHVPECPLIATSGHCTLTFRRGGATSPPKMLSAVSADNRGLGDMAEKKYTSVLGWDSPFDIACKLEREMERMQETESLRDFVEHTMNFALTAYHMTDWVWDALQREPADGEVNFERDSWTAVIGYKPETLSEVRSWAISQCPELEYCRQLSFGHLRSRADCNRAARRASRFSGAMREGKRTPSCRDERDQCASRCNMTSYGKPGGFARY